jgi:hypothetical protein
MALLSSLLLTGGLAAATSGSAASVLRVGYQLSPTLTAIFRADGELEKALGAP